ncbi:hypothetical protein KBB96_11930 [Luteolibacter ambystomatis]|uniref:Uncharacterized protein n=1 Tax=Luteolibacter ambystomatis TaxID=2824561 RepID=A0A975G695_9BACT|nr:hypothetical protein [Luteolibacter ambystomatis]QUE49582.1 hypothetical protein KBB96_11930 [Luteolibacter ambystomatis]
MSTSPSNSNTSATSSADARETFVAAALVANESALMAEALQTTTSLEPAREAVLAAFLGLCRQAPEQLPGGAKSWLEAEVRKQARRRAPKGPVAGEDVRWKRVAGAGESTGIPDPTPATLLPTQREAILHTARQAASAPDESPSRHPRWLMPMAGAAVAVIGGVLLINRSQHKEQLRPTPEPAPAAAAPAPSASSQAREAPVSAPAPAVADVSLPRDAFLLPLPGPPSGVDPAQPVMTTAGANARARDKALETSPADFLAAAARQSAANREVDLSTLPETVIRDHVPTSASKQLPLPLLAGSNSLSWISSSVTGKRALPPAKAVRLEELLNAFPLVPGGTTAIAKGTTLTVESLSCPWKPSASLVMLRFQGAADGPRSVEAALEVDPMAISQFRLLGYSPVKGLENETLPGILPAKTGTTLLIELEPRASARSLGEIRWKVDGKDVPALQIQRIPDAEPSDNARFATLLAVWSMWLTRDQPELVDEDLVSGLARECAGSDLPKDRRDALVLIAKSLELR